MATRAQEIGRITEIVEATGWAAYSACGMISGGLKKKLAFEVATSSDEQRGRIEAST